jgi:hypothetical protein
MQLGFPNIQSDTGIQVPVHKTSASQTETSKGIKNTGNLIPKTESIPF